MCKTTTARLKRCGIRWDADNAYPGAPGLDALPVAAGREWLETVNRAETEVELAALRRPVTHQGNDICTQYRSVIFYHHEQQRSWWNTTTPVQPNVQIPLEPA